MPKKSLKKHRFVLDGLTRCSLEDADPVAAAVSESCDAEEEPEEHRLYWMTTCLVLCFEDADPVAAAASSCEEPEEDRLYSSCWWMPKKSLKKTVCTG
jgi:hypothetical protein